MAPRCGTRDTRGGMLLSSGSKRQYKGCRRGGAPTRSCARASRSCRQRLPPPLHCPRRTVLTSPGQKLGDRIKRRLDAVRPPEFSERGSHQSAPRNSCVPSSLARFPAPSFRNEIWPDAIFASFGRTCFYAQRCSSSVEFFCRSDRRPSAAVVGDTKEHPPALDRCTQRPSLGLERSQPSRSRPAGPVLARDSGRKQVGLELTRSAPDCTVLS